MTDKKFDDRLGDYVDVPARIAEFRTKHPEGSLQPVDPANPYRVETIGDRTYIVVVAAAYRTPDDARPGIGMAYEQCGPGRTPYTRDSELQNAETSAWGRAIVAVLAADTKRGVASREEVRNRQADRELPEQTWDPADQESLLEGWVAEIAKAKDDAELAAIGKRIGQAKRRLSPNTIDRLASVGAERKAELNGGQAA